MSIHVKPADAYVFSTGNTCGVLAVEKHIDYHARAIVNTSFVLVLQVGVVMIQKEIPPWRESGWITEPDRIVHAFLFFTDNESGDHTASGAYICEFSCGKSSKCGAHFAVKQERVEVH